MNEKIVCRRLETLEEFIDCTKLQREVWGEHWRETISPEFMKVHAEMGALIMGAFVDGRMIGFVYSFPGNRRGEALHWSHMLAVADDFRGTGLGKRLKWLQREELLMQGFGKCCWTFDPLQPLNTRLNIVTLGAYADEYIVDAYGTRESGLDCGLPSDRFVAKWDLLERGVAERAAGVQRRRMTAPAEIAPVLELAEAGGRLLPGAKHLKLKARLPGVAIPADIREIIEASREAGLQWRLATREIFQSCFERGYALVDVLDPSESGSGCYIDVLERR